MKKYYVIHKKEILERSHDYYNAHRKKCLEIDKCYRNTHKKERAEENRKYRRKIRLQALNKLGGSKCIRCGCKEFDLLEINHRKGGGVFERKHCYSMGFYRSIIDGTRPIDDLEVVCMVCNAAHTAEVLKKCKGKYNIMYVLDKSLEN
jgi:hypothetical protein